MFVLANVVDNLLSYGRTYLKPFPTSRLLLIRKFYLTFSFKFQI